MSIILRFYFENISSYGGHSVNIYTIQYTLLYYFIGLGIICQTKKRQNWLLRKIKKPNVVWHGIRGQQLSWACTMKRINNIGLYTSL